MLNLDKPQDANAGDSSMVRAFLKAKSSAGGINADLLLLNCGLHDIKTSPATGQRQVPINQYSENLEAIIQLVRELGTKLIWIRTTPCDEKTHNQRCKQFHRFAADCDAYNHAADRIMQKFHIPMIDLYSFTKNLGQDLYCDHVHFHEHIREKQAAFIAGWLMAYAGI